MIPPYKTHQPPMTLEELRKIDFFAEAYNRSLQSTYFIRDQSEDEHENRQLTQAIVASAEIIHETLIRVHDSILEEIRKTRPGN